MLRRHRPSILSMRPNMCLIFFHQWKALAHNPESTTSTVECVNMNLWNFICLSKITLNNGRLVDRCSRDALPFAAEDVAETGGRERSARVFLRWDVNDFRLRRQCEYGDLILVNLFENWKFSFSLPIGPGAGEWSG